MLNITKTNEILNQHFKGSNDEVNKEYFTTSMLLFIDNTESLINSIRDTKRPIYQIVWQGIIQYINTELRHEYGKKYTASSYQLKKWIETAFNTDYKTVLEDLINKCKIEREEHRA